MARMNRAARVVDALLEDDDEDIERLTNGLDPNELEAGARVSIEVCPCRDDGRNVERIWPGEPFTPDFWTVYKRVFHYEGEREVEALAHAVQDFATEEEADAFAREQVALYRRLGRLHAG